MNDPFSILGVSQNATDEQIREAYRLQARRIQQQIDSGVNVPQAQQSMQELDAAYDAVILSRSGGASGAYYNASGAYSAPSSDYSDIRRTIRSGRLDDAQTILDGIPEAQRNAEWYFLKGCVQQRKGWLEEAAGNFSAACRLDPNNAEYKAAYEDMQNSRSGGYRTQRSGGGLSACDVCSGLLCADCCCECMGGDLIRCC
ncbi:MAG: J domain-containing protein [Clostridia bacterium]|nr:J domain-containing protein [Clostridia bacterium]